MRRFLAIAIAAVACVAVSPVASHAAGARITWQQSSSADHFWLFVTQPDVADSGVTEIDIINPDVANDGTFATDVHGLDPLYAAYFLMVSVSADAASSEDSNMVSLEPTDFCPVFDADQDGSVSVADALFLARQAVAPSGDPYADADPEASIVDALGALRVAAAYQCS